MLKYVFNYLVFNIIIITLVRFVTILLNISNDLYLFVLIFFIISLSSIYLLKTIRKHKLGWEELVVIVLIILVGVSYFLFHDYAFNGNDYTIAAVMAKFYSVVNSFYLPDNTLVQGVFSGFYFTDRGILPQFLPMYPSFLSFFYRFCGIEGLFIANSVLMITISLGFYLIIRSFSDKKGALFGVIFVVTNFLYIYFFQKTVFEIYLMFVFISCVQFLLTFLQNKKIVYLMGVSILLGIGLLTKLEIFPFIFFGFIAIKYISDYNNLPRKYMLYSYLLVITIALLFVQFTAYLSHPYILYNMKLIINQIGGLYSFGIGGIVFFLLLYFFDTKVIVEKMRYIKDFLIRNKRFYIVLSFLIILSVCIYVMGGVGIMTRRSYTWIFVLNMFHNYGIFLLLFFVPFVFINKWTRQFVVVFVMYIFGLYFIYHMGIGWTQPWAMRRFLAFTIPFLVVMVILVVNSLKSTKIQSLIYILLLLNNFLFSFSLWGTNEFKDLYLETKVFAENHTNTNIVLNKGWSWQKTIGYYLQFFNDSDIVVSFEGQAEIHNKKRLFISDKKLLSGNNISEFGFLYLSLYTPCRISGYIDKYGKAINTDLINNMCYFGGDNNILKVSSLILFVVD